MIVVCPTCEPFEHGDQRITWRLCPHHERLLNAPHPATSTSVLTLYEIDAAIRVLYERRRPYLRKARLEGLTNEEFIELRKIEDEIDELELLEASMKGHPIAQD